MLAALAGISMLAVDVGMLQLAKTEAQTGADAIARYAASGFESGGATLARTRAAAAAGDVRVAGQAISFNATSDLEFGVWDANTRTFAALPAGQEASCTAMRATIRMTSARGKSIPMYMARAFGINQKDMTTSTTVTRGNTIAPQVTGLMCPWLAGMPVGSTVTAYDGNPTSISGSQYQPQLINLSSFASGNPLRFRQSSGTTSMIGYSDITMDGDTGWMVEQQADNGINKTKAPIGALMGIFLDDRAPNTYSMATAGDFSSAASRDFTTLSPPLKQVFFIGDGLNSAGQLQDFVPPPGATRLYLGIMDEKGWWWDNTGSVLTNLMDAKITTVK
jgi:hypothetical protein